MSRGCWVKSGDLVSCIHTHMLCVYVPVAKCTFASVQKSDPPHWHPVYVKESKICLNRTTYAGVRSAPFTPYQSKKVGCMPLLHDTNTPHFVTFEKKFKRTDSALILVSISLLNSRGTPNALQTACLRPIDELGHAPVICMYRYVCVCVYVYCCHVLICWSLLKTHANGRYEGKPCVEKVFIDIYIHTDHPYRST
jgi:hypothetical protein